MNNDEITEIYQRGWNDGRSLCIGLEVKPLKNELNKLQSKLTQKINKLEAKNKRYENMLNRIIIKASLVELSGRIKEYILKEIKVSLVWEGEYYEKNK